MKDPLATLDGRTSPGETGGAGEAVPGLYLVFSGSAPAALALPLGKGGALELGRGSIPAEDARMSRRHAKVSFDGVRWRLEDLGSKNGSWLDGEPLKAAREAGPRAVLRTGDSLFLLTPDLRPLLEDPLEVAEGRVMGAATKRAWAMIARAAAAGDTLHINGESGSGKELAARSFHAAGKRAAGPFVAINCAAIPEGVAESLLFGATKGAFSGAHADSAGYLAAANGGTLFLDEVGELDLAVQAKLLRALETREVLALGATAPRKIDLAVVSATHRALRDRVAEKKFRQDLYFRIGRPEVALPPLRERREEIPHLVAQALASAAPQLGVGAGFMEACLLRAWPGNVRELFVEVRQAALQAAGARALEAKHLGDRAGEAFEEVEAEPEAQEDDAPMPSREAIEAALRKMEGRVASAARELGIHRNRLRRWLAKNEVDPAAFKAP